MPFFGRSTKKQLENQFKEKNNLTELPPNAAAQEIVRDGIDVLLQGQMVLREKGLSLSFKGKANFGALLAPKLLKLEVGVGVEGALLKKTTVLVMCGRQTFASISGAECVNIQPLMISCLEGWRCVGGGSLSGAVGVGGQIGKAGVSHEKEKSGESFKTGDAKSEGGKDTYEKSVGKQSMDVVKAEAKYFAGLEAEVSGKIERYYGVDDNPLFMARGGHDGPVLEAIQDAITEGSVKGVMKIQACRFIEQKAPLLGPALSYKTTFGHVKSSLILERLAKAPRTGPLFERAEALKAQLLPYDGQPSRVHGLTYLYIGAKEGAFKFRIGATFEASASIPALAVGFKAEANLLRMEGSARTVHLRFQAPIANVPGIQPQVYHQNVSISYKKFEMAVLEASFDVTAEVFGRNYSLAQWVAEKFPDKTEGRATDLLKLLEALTSWLEFPKGRDGLSVSLAKASTSTMTYRCASIVYNQPTDGQVRNRSIHAVDALVGTGGIWGMTYTIGNLARMADTLKLMPDTLNGGTADLYKVDDIEESDLKVQGDGTDKVAGLLNKFKRVFHANAATIKVGPKELGEFILGFGDMAHAIGQELGEGQGLLVEAARSLPEAERVDAAWLDVSPDGVISLQESVAHDILETIEADLSPKPDVIRLRFRMSDSVDRSLGGSIGFSFDDVGELTVGAKAVWNMDVEGIPTFYELFFRDPTMNNLNPDETRQLVVPPPLLFKA